MSYFFFDIDGTIKPNHTDISVMPEPIIHSIRSLIRNGHQVFLCTGRSYYMCDFLSDDLGTSNAIIDNGCGIILNDQLLVSHPIDPDVLNQTRALLEELHADYQLLDAYFAYRTLNLFERWKGPAIRQTQRHQDSPLKKVTNYDNSPILKIDVYFKTDEEMDAFKKRINPSLQLITNSGYNKGEHSLYGEVTLAQYNKGTAIKEVIDYLHGDLNDTYGFGDSDNDLGMLEVVKHPVVVRPGSPLLNKLAEYECDPPQKDGITKALKHYKFID